MHLNHGLNYDPTKKFSDTALFQEGKGLEKKENPLHFLASLFSNAQVEFLRFMVKTKKEWTEVLQNYNGIHVHQNIGKE